MSARTLLGALALALLTACGGGSDSKSTAAGTNTNTAATSSTADTSGSTTQAAATLSLDEVSNLVAAERATYLGALQSNQPAGADAIPLPAAGTEVPDSGQVQTAAATAQSTTGTRGAFEQFHNEVAPLLPASAVSRALNASTTPATFGMARAQALMGDVSVNIVCVNGDVDGDINNGCQPPNNNNNNNCPVECAQDCAEAEAKAVAAAFAFASATACAWAEAWACVYERIPPFNKVCAWAKSSACFTAFVGAFAAFSDYEKDKQCIKVCSDGQVTRWKEPVAAK
jgi:hypothetical protein